MKGQISRDSYRQDSRYSGVYQVQGGMVTDADLSERSEVAKRRTDGLGHDTAGHGCPVDGGAIDFSGATPELREGVIYAEGVRGDFRLAEGETASTVSDFIDHQADLPDGPALTNGERLIFADIWERPVFALEDEYLADVGLHGAETGFRTRTMCQLKHAPVSALSDIENGTGRFPPIGTGTLAVAPADPATVTDNCDPCATVVTLEQIVPNALWRIEIVRVDGPADAPTRIDIAWSRENGAVIAPSDVSSEVFERAGAAYELFSPTTESHMGALAASTAVRNSQFVDDLDVPPAVGTSFPFVRRWDGYARLTMAGNGVQTLPAGNTAVTFDGTDFVVTTEDMTATLTLGSRSVLRGDYWLVELRTFIEEADRISVVSSDPVGIVHNYCVLFRTSNGVMQPLTDAQERMLSFPALSDLPADHVGFVNTCKKLYGNAENVQEALDELCNIEAEDVGFDPTNCPGLYEGADTVQEALDALCNKGFSSETLVRHLFDWGVVCGIIVRLRRAGGDVVRVTPGRFIDRAGRLLSYDGGDINVTELFKSLTAAERTRMSNLLAKGQVCLTLARNAQGQVSAFVVPKDEAFGPPDPSFLDNLRSCIENKGRITVNDRFETLREEERLVVGKVALVSSQKKAFGGGQSLSQSEARVAAKFTNDMAAEFKEIADEDETAALNRKFAQIEEEFGDDGSVGEARDIRQMQKESARLTAVLESDQERALRCLCESLFPTCPPNLGQPPFHVPIACLTGRVGDRAVLTDVCMFGCRKQAITWRSVDYIFREWRERIQQNFEQLCFREDEPDSSPKLDYYAELNQASFNQIVNRYDFTKNVFVDHNRPSDLFEQKFSVEGLSAGAAKDVVTGNGAELVDTIDIGSKDAADLVAKQSTNVSLIDQISETGKVRPGDKVVLLTQNGQARGYVVVEKGAGKYIFETETKEKPGKGDGGVIKPGDVKDLEGVIDRFDQAKLDSARFADEIGTLSGERDRLRSDIHSLKAEADRLDADRKRDLAEVQAEKDSLQADLDRIKSDTTELDIERTKALKEIQSARATLDEFATVQAGIVAELEKARNELKAADDQKVEFVQTIRRNQPLGVAGLDEDTTKKLAESGVVTVGDASTVRLNDLVRRRVITRAEANRISQSTKTFLHKDIQ